MSTIAASTLAGLSNSQSRVNQSAQKIAIQDTPEGKDVDLAEELTKVQVASNDFSANATVAKVEKQVTDRLLDILA